MKVLLLCEGEYHEARKMAMCANYSLIYQLADSVELSVYGTDCSKSWDKDTYEVYEPPVTMEDVCEYVNPDIVLCWCKEQTRLTSFFDELKIPKVIIEMDLYRMSNIDWYKRFNLMIVRGSYDTVIPSVRVPLSFNEGMLSECRNIQWNQRKNNTGFVGNGVKQRKDIIYEVRRKVVRKLEEANLITNYGYVGNECYPLVLSNHKIMLSCSGGRGMMLAKTFEIIGAGSILLTEPIKEWEKIFSKKYWVEYTSPVDAVKKVKEILKNIDKYKSIVKEGKKEIQKRHLHKHRVDELLAIFTSLIEGAKVPRKWGK